MKLRLPLKYRPSVLPPAFMKAVFTTKLLSRSPIPKNSIAVYGVRKQVSILPEPESCATAPTSIG